MKLTIDPLAVVCLVYAAALLAWLTGDVTLERWMVAALTLGLTQVRATYKSGPSWLPRAERD